MMEGRQQQLTQPGLFIGGLRNDLHPANLAGLICALLRKFQVEVPKNCVHITSRPNQTFAIVDLHDDSISNYLLSQLFYLENVQNVFDLRAITWSPHDLRVGPKLTNGDRKRRSRSRAKKREKQRLASESRSPGGLNHHPNHAHVSRETQKNDFTRSRMSSHGNQAQGFPVVSQDSKHSHGSGQSSESDEDFMDAVSSQPSATKVFSNSTVSSEGSFHRLDRPGPSRDSRPAGLQARGVTRLKEEHGLDSVGRALSDQQIPAQEGTRNTTTSTTGLPRPSNVSVTTSTPGTTTGMAATFYRIGQLVGRESRHSEFKQGGMAHRERAWLQETVGKYVCGFLNSSEGGTLYIGVNDKGEVTGFQCSQSTEDSYRLLIDEALKSIDPPVFTDVYTVRFVPVMDSSGRLSDMLCVLEVEVKEVKRLRHLYDFRGNAYVRRDGSLQGPLKARQVQEWTRKQLERENSSGLLRSQLQEMTSQLAKEREKNDQMQQQLVELENCVSQLTEEMESRGRRCCYEED